VPVCVRTRTGRHAQAEVKFRKLTTFSLWYIFIDSYAYLKLFLFILQIIIITTNTLKRDRQRKEQEILT
jgi:hypothetical protein